MKRPCLCGHVLLMSRHKTEGEPGQTNFSTHVEPLVESGSHSFVPKSGGWRGRQQSNSGLEEDLVRMWRYNVPSDE